MKVDLSMLMCECVLFVGGWGFLIKGSMTDRLEIRTYKKNVAGHDGNGNTADGGGAKEFERPRAFLVGCYQKKKSLTAGT